MTLQNENPTPAATPTLPTVEAIAMELLLFEYQSEHELQWGCDVMLQIVDGAWSVARVDFESNESDLRRFYIGPGMSRYESFAMARAMVHGAKKGGAR